MKIVAMMLCGGEGRKEMAVRAALSVAEFVDAFLLVDTGWPSKETIGAVTEALSPKGGFNPLFLPYQGKPICGAMRNAALDAAETTGCDWAMQLDTDEIWKGDAAKTRAFLEATTADIAIAWNDLGVYTKERFFRLPAKGRFSTSPPVHEGYGDTLSKRTIMPLEDFSFWEEPKSKEQQQKNDLVIAELCRETLRAEPTNYRAAYYLADALVRQGSLHEAQRFFAIAANSSPYHQEAGWALFRQACCLHDQQKHISVCEVALHGMGIAPMFPELPWIIALSKLELKEYHEAVAYANMAIAVGSSTNLQQQGYIRLGFRFPPAHTYGPWEIRTRALEAIGQVDAAKESYAMVLHQVANSSPEVQAQFGKRVE